MATPAKIGHQRATGRDHNPTGQTSRAFERGNRATGLKTKRAPLTILVVDDHPLLLKLVVEMLKSAHFTVLAANGPKEALEIETNFRGAIDLLLSDIMMPGMNGPDLAGLLSTHRPKMRIILMSAYTDGDIFGLNKGWHFIQKPFDTASLVSRVKRVLKSRTLTGSSTISSTRTSDVELPFNI